MNSRMEWISVKDRLPEQGEGDHDWVGCIVTVSETRWPTSTYDSVDSPQERVFVTYADFDCSQKIWFLKGSDMALNALIPVEDAPLNGYAVTHWMPMPDGPARRDGLREQPE